MKISCTVDNCSHNKSHTCFANIVKINGAGAKKDCDTCCSSFLDNKIYSSLTNNTNSSGECDSLSCNVTNCTYNCDSVCQLDSISVNGKDVNLYSETNCSSFEKK